MCPRQFRRRPGGSALGHQPGRRALDLAVRHQPRRFLDDTNAGNSPITTSFIDHVTITNLTTDQVLGVADIPYNVDIRGPLAAGASAAQQYAFQLPNGNPGVGTIQFTVTADNYDAVSGA